jgi:hypothetical protein
MHRHPRGFSDDLRGSFAMITPGPQDARLNGKAVASAIEIPQRNDLPPRAIVIGKHKGGAQPAFCFSVRFSFRLRKADHLRQELTNGIA